MTSCDNNTVVNIGNQNYVIAVQQDQVIAALFNEVK